MNVLIGCEFSAVVRDEFEKRGHEAWSCDLLPSEKPGKHFVLDVFDAIGNNCFGYGWDLIILHPPCTKIALCGNSTYGKGMPKHGERKESIRWTKHLWDFARQRCERVAMENPKNVMGRVIGKKSQTIHPYQFGHAEQKETWLWLSGLPKLEPTKDVYDEMMRLPRAERERLHYMSPSKDRGHERSRTFPGIAKAMADQWSSQSRRNIRQTQL